MLNQLWTFVKTDIQHLIALKSLSRLLSSGSLVIISPSVDDTATYECTVTNDAGEDKRTVGLTVQGRTGLVCGLKVITMISFLFTTSQRGFLFHLPNIHLQCRKRKITWVGFGNLSGLETCSFLSFCCCFLVPPSIADEPTDFLVTTHTPTVITCTASGVPFPSIHWMKNGIRLLPRGEGYRILSSGKTQLSDYTDIDWVSY